jgi:hypothetical protein
VVGEIKGDFQVLSFDSDGWLVRWVPGGETITNFSNGRLCRPVPRSGARRTAHGRTGCVTHHGFGPPATCAVGWERQVAYLMTLGLWAYLGSGTLKEDEYVGVSENVAFDQEIDDQKM